MKRDIEQLLSLSEDELLFRIGKEITGTAARGESRLALIGKAKVWLSSRSEFFGRAICSNPTVREVMALSPDEDRKLQLVAAVSDVLSTILIGIPPFTIAVMLVRVGLDDLCKESDSNASK